MVKYVLALWVVLWNGVWSGVMGCLLLLVDSFSHYL